MKHKRNINESETRRNVSDVDIKGTVPFSKISTTIIFIQDQPAFFLRFTTNSSSWYIVKYIRNYRNHCFLRRTEAETKGIAFISKGTVRPIIEHTRVQPDRTIRRQLIRVNNDEEQTNVDINFY